MTQVSRVISHIPAGKVKPFQGFKVQSERDIADLRNIGIVFDSADLNEMYAAYKKYNQPKMAMDADLIPPLTTPSVTTPLQFLQAWMPGFVQVVTRARKIDDFIGLTTIGDWEDEEVVQGFSERTGFAQPYLDETNPSLSSYNVNFERRTVVRFDSGIRIGRLAERRASKMNYSDVDNRRVGATEALEINRNYIGFYGYNSGEGRTYGYLTDPNFLAYVNVPDGAAGTSQWATKTMLEIIKDIQSNLSALRVQSGDLIDVKKTSLKMQLPMSCIDLLSTSSELGYSVLKWLADNYPNVEVESAPELDQANGGENVMYLYAPSYSEGSTDDGKTIDQLVPAKFMTLGVQQLTKGYEEAYSNATAGVLCKRPWLIRRVSGI